MITLDDKSVRKLMAELERVGPRELSKKLRRPMQRAMREVRNIARNNVSRGQFVRTGALKDSIVLGKFVRRKRSRILWSAVGIEKGFEKTFRLTIKRPRGSGTMTVEIKARPRRYAHLIEFGFVHTSGAHIRGRAFMRSAFKSQKNNLEKSIVQTIKGFME